MTGWHSRRFLLLSGALAVALIGMATTPASAAVCSYDAPVIARVDVQSPAAGMLRAAEPLERPASGRPEATDSLSTVSGYSYATNAIDDAVRGVDDVIDGLPLGRQPHVRTVSSDGELQGIFDDLTTGATPISGRTTYDGTWALRTDGVEVGLRNASRTGGRTIDIVYPDGSRVVVHIE